MKISVKILIIVAAITMAGGLLLGWVFFGRSEEVHSHAGTSDTETVWTCSMHPQIRQNEPGSCPICGMDLIPLENNTNESIDARAISMSPTAMQLANVSTAVVGEGKAVKTIRLNGKVQADERLVYSQSTHFSGRVEKLTVNFTGEFVSKGSTIATLYSPELVTAQEELLEAHKIRKSQPYLYQAAREKLKNWKLTDRQIDQIISSGKVGDKFPVKADQSGYVISKMVNPGDYVKRGQALYKMANLSRVWILFDVYESELPWINKKDSVQFTIGSLPGKKFSGVIEYLDPVIDPKTRVAKARVVVKNGDHQLKPEMFASGEVKSEIVRPGTQLTVPKSAVMWTGKRSVVYVKLQTDQGLHFKMREVTLGPALGDAFIVEEGLNPGEEIVVNGTFSIDAAAQLAGKPSMMSPQGASSSQGGAAMTGHSHGGMTPPQTDHSQHEVEKQLEVNKSDQTYASDPEFRSQLRAVFTAYLPVKDALVASDAKMASQRAKDLLSVISKVDMTLVKGDAHKEWMKDLEVLHSTTKKMVNESDLEIEREMLSPLSDQLFHTLKKFQVEVSGFRQYCPMVADNQGAYWLSDSDEVLNPYFGNKMLTCGNVEEEL